MRCLGLIKLTWLAIVVVLTAWVLEVMLIDEHPRYKHYLPYWPQSSKTKDGPTPKEGVLIALMMKIDQETAVPTNDMCDLELNLDLSPGCRTVPADWNVGMYKVRGSKEWKVAMIEKRCYHDFIVRKWRQDLSPLTDRNLTTNICKLSDPESSVEAAMPDPQCTLFDDAESKMYIKLELAVGQGRIMYKSNGRILHLARSNVDLPASPWTFSIQASNGVCVKAEITREVIDAEVLESDIGFVIDGIQVLNLYPLPPFAGSPCWYTNAGVEVCKCTTANSEQVPVFNDRILTLKDIQNERAEVAAERHKFCISCKTSNQTSSKLKMVCDQQNIYQFHYQFLAVELKYTKGIFKSGDWIFDSRIGALVPEYMGDEVPRFHTLPTHLYLFNKTYIANCSVDLQGMVTPKCNKIPIEANTTFSDYIEDYSISSIYMPKLRQHIHDKLLGLSSFWAILRNSWDVLTSWARSWAYKVIGLLIILILISATYLVVKSKNKQYVPLVVVGKRGTRMDFGQEMQQI